MTISSALAELAACLCAEIEEGDTPKTCFCGVVPGQAAVADFAGDCDELNGMAWVRLITAYPAAGVGVQATTTGTCSTGIGFDVEIGMLRHWPIEIEGKDEAETLAAAELSVADMLTMRRAIACCDAFTGKDYILGTYTPIGPLGDLVGGSWTIYVML